VIQEKSDIRNEPGKALAEKGDHERGELGGGKGTSCGHRSSAEASTCSFTLGKRRGEAENNEESEQRETHHPEKRIKVEFQRCSALERPAR